MLGQGYPWHRLLLPQSEGGLEDDGEELEDASASKYKLLLEEVDNLLKVIHATLGIKEEEKDLSLHVPGA